MPFDINKYAFNAKLHIINRREVSIVGDVASSYLNYTDLFIENNPSVKIICLKREKESCVQSFLRKTVGRNNFQYGKEPRTIFGITSPDYPSILTKKEAIRTYYDDYYKIAEKFEKKYSNNFKIFDMECLNTSEGVNDILEFCGYEEKDRIISIGLRFNETKK